MSNERAPSEARVAFVDSKPPDWERLHRICELSVRAQRWTNFGPVGEALGEAIARMLGLAPGRAVVPASSATSALHAIAGMRAVRAGRPLVWVVSAYSFPSLAVGPFAGSIRIVDCDAQGLLDLDQAARLPPDSYDGIVFTNVFGLTTDFSRYGDFCANRDKQLIIDNASAFPAPRPTGVAADEIISFHHTKPWGFGEGGCAVVNRDDAGLVRGFLSFGGGAGAAFAGFAGNGKISDLAAAAILDRLERIESWSPACRAQRARIAGIVAEAGLSTLGAPPDEAVRAHIPVLAPGPLTLAEAPPARFDLAKYYRPLAEGHPVAAALYARMINVPCHPGMAAIEEAELRRFFSAMEASGHDR